jgi:shikimate dehydrogenase
MKSEPSPISTKTINEKSVVYDIVSKPINTDLIQQSKKNGATIIYGYEMLLGQAALAFKIWHGIEAPYDTMKKSILGIF